MNAPSPRSGSFARRRCPVLVAVAASAVLLAISAVDVLRAAGPRALPAGELPDDRRLGNLKNLDGYFPMTVPKSAEAWKKRADRVRRQVLVGCGLWPLPEKTPLKAVVHGKVDRDDYTVEKVYFESLPGFYVTGNLYRPKGGEGEKKRPGVLCPHGHWSNGRFHDHGEAGVKREIAAGAEKFPTGGRHPIQARCVQLARMGCVVFQYDMIGYADSVQLSFDLAHRYGTSGFRPRAHLESPRAWGLYSAQAELRSQSIFGLQTYNSIRALDWLGSLADVDPQRIAVTGSSGGGTQTFILCAVDPRPAVAFPAVMVSTAMQGGCTCENCTYLRVGTGNIELAGLFAPKPLAMSAANDWTKEIETKGLPEIKKLYAMLGAPDLVAGKHFNFGHNYNYVSRAMMYPWMNRHLKLGLPEPIVEQDYRPLTRTEMTVWDEKHPRPKAGDEAFEVKLLKEMDGASRRQLAALAPRDKKTLARYREIVGGAVDVMIGRSPAEIGPVQDEKKSEQDRGKYIEITLLLKTKRHGESLPAVFLMPKEHRGEVVIWIDTAGKSGLFGSDGSPRPEVRALLDAGRAVVGVDLLYQGEFLADGKPLAQSRKVGNTREYAGYTLGYNHPLFCQRVHDVMTVVGYCAGHEKKPKRIHLFGLAGAGKWVAAAAAQLGTSVDRVAVDTGGFRFARLQDIRHVDLLPGAVKYGDVPALLALAAPHRLWLAGEGNRVPQITAAAYRAAGHPDAVTSYSGSKEASAAAAVTWLLAK